MKGGGSVEAVLVDKAAFCSSDNNMHGLLFLRLLALSAFVIFRLLLVTGLLRTLVSSLMLVLVEAVTVVGLEVGVLVSDILPRPCVEGERGAHALLTIMSSSFSSIVVVITITGDS